MDSENLIRMANSIGEFFEAMPDRDAAINDVANHIRKFWEPRMRRELLAALDAGGHGASDIVVRAIGRHRVSWPEAAVTVT